MKENFTKVREIIERYNDFVITTHLLPDGDAIGSALSIADYLRAKGKKAAIINYSPTPDYLEFLDEKKEIRCFKFDRKSNIPLIEKAEVIILVDTNEFSRTK